MQRLLDKGSFAHLSAAPPQSKKANISGPGRVGAKTETVGVSPRISHLKDDSFIVPPRILWISW